jgi:hypothetical protein
MSQHTPGPCACRYEWQANRIYGTSVSVPVGRIVYCPTHATAPEMASALREMLKAADELMTEFVSKKRAANWGVINAAMVAASALLARTERKS